MSLILDLKRQHYTSCSDVTYTLHENACDVPFRDNIIMGTIFYTSGKVLPNKSEVVIVEYSNPRFICTPVVEVYLTTSGGKVLKYQGLQITCNKDNMREMLLGLNVISSMPVLSALWSEILVAPEGVSVYKSPYNRQGFQEVTINKNNGMMSLMFV